jgi:serine/threonine protein kinase
MVLERGENPKLSRACTNYNRVEENRRASRNGPVSELTLTLTRSPTRNPCRSDSQRLQRCTHRPTIRRSTETIAPPVSWQRFGNFSEALVRLYTRQLLLGLEYLHSCKIIHRDLKGANVLITRDGVVKLADFGASKVFKEGTVTDGMKSLKGSLFWMAPEVRRVCICTVPCGAHLRISTQ